MGHQGVEALARHRGGGQRPVPAALDHDGDQDIVAVNESNGSGVLGQANGEVVILKNNGSGVLTKVKTLATPVDPVSVVVANLEPFCAITVVPAGTTTRPSS